MQGNVKVYDYFINKKQLMCSDHNKKKRQKGISFYYPRVPVCLQKWLPMGFEPMPYQPEMCPGIEVAAILKSKMALDYSATAALC